MPPMPAPIAGESFSLLGCSTTTASVVVSKEDTLHKRRSNEFIPGIREKRILAIIGNYLKFYQVLPGSIN